MKNRLKKLNIFFIVICIIISSIIPTAAFAASEDDLRSSVVSIASDEVGYTGTSSYSKYGDCGSKRATKAAACPGIFRVRTSVIVS